MTLYSQFELVPDERSGSHGVYTSHVKYTTSRSSPCNIDFWVTKDLAGSPHPQRIQLFFRSADVTPPSAWTYFRLNLSRPGDTRPEYRSVIDSRGRFPITGVYIDYFDLPEPLPQQLVLWVLGLRGTSGSGSSYGGR
jgi:hypothetical protein